MKGHPPLWSINGKWHQQDDHWTNPGGNADSKPKCHSWTENDPPQISNQPWSCGLKLPTDDLEDDNSNCASIEFADEVGVTNKVRFKSTGFNLSITAVTDALPQFSHMSVSLCWKRSITQIIIRSVVVIFHWWGHLQLKQKRSSSQTAPMLLVFLIKCLFTPVK